MQATTTSLERLVERYEQELLPLSDAQLDRRPADGGWSARETLAHLVTTVELYNTKFEALLAGRAQGPGASTHRPTWVARLLLSVLGKSGPEMKKVKAPRAFRPGDDVSAYKVERLIAVHRRLIELGTQVETRGLGATKIPTPISRLLRLAACDAYEVQRLHGERHLTQALRAAGQGS
jgi:hypothetical protein